MVTDTGGVGIWFAKETQCNQIGLGVDGADGVSMLLGLGWGAVGLGGGECSQGAQRFPGIIDYFDHRLGLMPALEQEGR